MNASVRVLGIALLVLMLAARGFADEAEDCAERYLKKRGMEVFREADDDPVRRPFTHVREVRIYFPDKLTDEVMNQLPAFKHLKHLLIQSPGYPNYRETGAVTDERLKTIAGLKELVTLELWGQFTDDGLKHLAGFKKLKKLALRGHRMKGTGLKHLSALNQLSALKLRDTAIDDDVLKGIGELKNLETLDLSFTKITDDGLKHLAELQKLRELNIGLNDHITDKGMKHVAALTELRDLWLYGTQVTDAGLAELAPLQKLEGLNLVSVKGVTDKGLRNLRALKNLRGVNAGGTRATDQGVSELRKSNPQIGVRLRDEDEDDRRRRVPTPPPPPDNTAKVWVMVPANAEIWFDGVKTAQTGRRRLFVSPLLTPGKTYSYTIKARWLENGTPVEETRTIDVSANRISRVDFIKAKPESLAPHRGDLLVAVEA